MPRIRVVKKPEDAAGIPETDSIQVELDRESVETDDETKGKEIDVQAQSEESDEGGPSGTQEEDEEKVSLKKQLEDLRRANEEHRRVAEEALRQHQVALTEVGRKDRELSVAHDYRDQADLDAITSAMAAADSEAASAQQAYEAAQTNQDFKAAAEAQRRLTRAETRLVQLEDGKHALEARRERVRNEPKPTPTPPSLESYIDSMPNLSGSQKDWLKKHPELMQDQRKNIRLQNAHLEAEDKGFTAGSTDYFQYIEERLGYRKEESTVATEETKEPKRGPGVSAPVSRDAPNLGSGKPAPTRIKLSPEQRAAAKAAGIDDITYAENLIKLQQMKREGRYGEH